MCRFASIKGSKMYSLVVGMQKQGTLARFPRDLANPHLEQRVKVWSPFLKNNSVFLEVFKNVSVQYKFTGLMSRIREFIRRKETEEGWPKFAGVLESEM